jgi:hypothetical protein
MIQLGSKVRVVRPGRFEFRGEVVDMGPTRFGRRSMVKVRPDPDQVAVVAAPGELDRWVRVTECVEEEPVVPDLSDAPSPRPTRDDAVALRVLSDQLEELGLDAGAALLRDVAGRIERQDEAWKQAAEFLDAQTELARSILGDLKAMPPAGDFPN